MARKNGSGTELSVIGTDVTPGVGRVESLEEINALMSRGKILPQVHAIEPGSYVKGKLIGRGPEVEYTDASGDVKPLKTWNVEVAPGIVLACISSYQLETELPPLIGKPVTILKAAKKSLGDRQVNKFIISDDSQGAAA